MNIYEQAYYLQDACNPLGVARALVEIADGIREEEQQSREDGLWSMDTVCKHPAFILTVDKLWDMCGRPGYNEYGEAWHHTMVEIHNEQMEEMKEKEK